MNDWRGVLKFYQPVTAEPMRHAPVLDFPESPTYPIGNRIKLRLVVPGQIRALEQERANRAIGILIDASPPWAVRIAEIHRNPRMGAELPVGYLFAAVTRPCIALNPLAERTLVSRDFDQVALPVFRELAIHNLERAHMDALPVGQVPTAILTIWNATGVWAACPVQTGNTFLARISPEWGVDDWPLTVCET